MAPIAKKRKLIKKMSPPTPYPTKSSVISGQLEKQIENRKNKKPKSKPERGILFVKNLPHQFVEAQMKNYFKQFGKVTNLRLVRSKKSGNSKGFAYVEFEVPEVAQVVAETMNNYVMFQKLLKAAYIPPDEQKFNYFKTSVKKIKNSVGKTKYISSTTRRIMKQMKKQNNWDDEAYMKRTQEAMKKLNKIKKKYANLGINFDNFVVKPGGLLEQKSDSSSTVNSEESSGVTENSDDDAEIEEDAEVTPKLTKKRKATALGKVAANGKNKKSKNLDNNSPTVKDLLGDTLPDEDTSDDDVFIPNSSINAKSLVSKKNKSNGKKESLELEDLLGRTLEDNDDSSDEDFTESRYDDDDDSVDSELDELDKTVDFIKEVEALKNDDSNDNDNEKDNSDDDDDNDDADDNDDDSDEEAEEKENVKINKKHIKPEKSTKIDLLEKLTKRKPKLGAIQKVNKNPQHNLKKSNKTEKLKLVVAKELIKSQKANNLKKLKKNKKQKV